MRTIAHVDVSAERERARRAHRERRWTDAVDAFTAVDAAGPLGVEDLERLAEALDLVGRGDDAVAALQRAYTARAVAADVGEALRDAFWLWRALAFNAEFAQAGAWIARAARLVEAHSDCAQQGYLLLPEAERELRDGDYRAAFDTAGRAAAGAADAVTRIWSRSPATCRAARSSARAGSTTAWCCSTRRCWPSAPARPRPG